METTEFSVCRITGTPPNRITFACIIDGTISGAFTT
jgi:hypothetical protein